MAEQIKLVESLSSASGSKVGKRWKARIIEANRWGSSAYYPAEVLERDAHVFGVGLAMYKNHPTDSEKYERPERSVDDLVGKLITEAKFEDDGLYAEVEFYDSFLEKINELHEDVGLSVRASGLTEESERDGRYGPVLMAILAADSVDVVTKAGAGGKLTSILESDRDLAGRPVEQEEVKNMTDVTKEDFETLRSDITAAITSLKDSLVEAIKPAPVELTDEQKEAKAKADAEAADKPEDVEIDHAAVVQAVAEAQLPAVTAGAIVADIKAGKSIEDAVKVQTDLREAFLSGSESGELNLQESGKATGLSRAVELLGK